MGSSTSVINGTATDCPSRPANSDRPLMADSALSVDESTPRNEAVTRGSNTTVSRRDAGLRAPSMRVARSAASVAAWATSSSSGLRPTE